MTIDEALDKLLRAQDRAQLKAHRDLEAQQKREDRAIKAAARKTKKALEKAQRERDKLAKKALKQLQTQSSPAATRRRGRQPKQKQSNESVVIVTEPEVQTALEQPKSRTGRAVKRPRFFDGIRVYRLIHKVNAITMSYISFKTNVFTWRYSNAKLIVLM